MLQCCTTLLLCCCWNSPTLKTSPVVTEERPTHNVFTPSVNGHTSTTDHIRASETSDNMISNLLLARTHRQVARHTWRSEQPLRWLCLNYSTYLGSKAAYHHLMKTCAGMTELTGRKGTDFQIEVCAWISHMESNAITTNKSEHQRSLSHMLTIKHIAPYIPELSLDTQMMSMLGKDDMSA